MDIKANASYIKGLAEGYELSEDSKEGKVIAKMLELLEAMAERVEVQENKKQDLEEKISKARQEDNDFRVQLNSKKSKKVSKNY